MISSVTNGRIKQVVQWQSKAKERKKSGVFVVEGIRMYEEAPADWILETYVSSREAERLSKASDARERALWLRLMQTGFEEVSQEAFAKISDTSTPQGILCVLRQPVYTLEGMLKKDNPLLLILEDLQDPGNLGTILRTGEGAGVDGIIMSRDTVDIYNPKTVRSTMGSIYRVPYVYVDDLRPVLDVLREKQICAYAAHLAGKTYYHNMDFRAGTAFLIGNEGNGLRPETARLAASYVKIPMEGQVESLNAAMSAGLLVYEAHRQRHA